MKRAMTLAAVAALMGAGLRAQESEENFKPTKQHDQLRQFEGSWTSESTFHGDKERAPETCKGVETNRLALGNYWLMSEFRGEMKGRPFEGHGMMGYDVGKKKFVQTWINSVSPCFAVAEGDADADGKTFTLHAEGVDPKTGKAMKQRWVHEFKGKDERTLTFYDVTARDAKDKPSPQGGVLGTIKYKRSGDARTEEKKEKR